MAHEHANRVIQSEVNNTGETRMLAMIHDTGLIGVGTMKKSGKWSAELWDPSAVRDHALQMIDMCDLAEGKVAMDELRERDAADEEE